MISIPISRKGYRAMGYRVDGEPGPRSNSGTIEIEYEEWRDAEDGERPRAE